MNEWSWQAMNDRCCGVQLESDDLGVLPLFAQPNGLAERSVRSAKNLLEKCFRDGADPFLALLHIRNVPRYNLAQRLFSRQARTWHPVDTVLLKP